jgi:uncharacterized protein YydD (DUF2326 family)
LSAGRHGARLDNISEIARASRLREDDRRIRKAAKGGELGRLFEKAADLRTKLAVAEARAVHLKDQIKSFKVVPQYEALEKEATDLTRVLNTRSDENVIDRQLVDELRRALDAEADPATQDLTKLYEEAGVVLPGVVTKRYADVEALLGALCSREHDFQYLVTMNSDALPKDGFDKGFRVEDHILPIRLTDASETGGLFGLRFE